MRQLHPAENNQRIAILQTGRLGDLWYTTPMAWALTQRGWEVEVIYDDAFGDPFHFFPYIRSRPVRLTKYASRNQGWGHFYNEAVWQLQWLHRLRKERTPVVWNQVFPFRWIQAHLKHTPYVEYWYRTTPEINYRETETTLSLSDDRTILVFLESQSVSFSKDAKYEPWIFNNLEALAETTGCRPVVVAYGKQPDHPTYETWRGDLNEYQQRIAACSMVYGIITSAHVLGQLLGKPIIALYSRQQSIVDTIGAETVALRQGESITPYLEHVIQAHERSQA